MPDNTIIVATDGSDHSLRVLPHAQSLATALGASMELLRVAQQDEIHAHAGEDESGARGRLLSEHETAMRRDLRRFGVEAAVQVVIAAKGEDPADVLLRSSARGVLLAMHSRGRGGIARILQGSVSMSVLKRVEQPVMLGGPELLPPPVSKGPFRLLITTDLSPDADHAMRTIAPLLERGEFEATLSYIHLHAPQGIDNEAQRAGHEASLEIKRKLLPESVPVEIRLPEIPIGGGIDTAILEEAEETHAQAIVMATHGHSARRHLLMGSVAMSVLGRSRLPLIVSRARG